MSDEKLVKVGPMMVSIDGVTMPMDEYMFRRMVAAKYGLTVIEGNFSALKCERVLPHIDFLRDSQSVIALKYQDRQDTEHVKALVATPLLKINYADYGMVFKHNMPCAVYSTTEVAVLNCNTGDFHPSWKAQEDGWRLIQAKSKFQRWLLRFFN